MIYYDNKIQYHPALVVDDIGMFEETVADLKQNKARSKTLFTKARKRLLVLLQEHITVEQTDGECEQLDKLMKELLEVTNRLLAKYKVEKDVRSNDKLSSEIEQIETQLTDAQNCAQRIRDELRGRELYSKFVKKLNKELSVLLDKEQHGFLCRVVKRLQRKERNHRVQSVKLVSRSPDY